MNNIRDIYFKYMPKDIDIIKTKIEEQAEKIKEFDRDEYDKMVSESSSLKALEEGIAELEKIGKIDSSIATYLRVMVSNPLISDKVKNIKSVIIATTIEQKELAVEKLSGLNKKKYKVVRINGKDVAIPLQTRPKIQP